MKSWTEKLLMYGSCALVLVLPLLCFGGWYMSYVTSKMIIFYGVVELLFLMWVYRMIVDRSYRLTGKQWFTFSPFIAYVAWLTLAGVLGADWSASLWSSFGRGTGLLTMYHVLAFAIVIAALVRKFGAKNLGYCLLGSFVVGSGLAALTIWIGNEGLALPIRVLELSKGGGLVGNSSLAAGYLIFGFFFALFLVFARDAKKWMKVVSWTTLGLIVFSPLFLNAVQGFSVGVSARGAALGIAVGLVAAALVWTALSKKTHVRLIGIALSVIFLTSISAGFYSLANSSSRLHERFVESAGEGRFLFWDAARSAMEEKPLFGYGPENFRVAYHEHFDPKIYTVSTAAEVWTDRAHNVFFDTGVAGGWPAIVWYAAILLSLFTELYRAHVRGVFSRMQTGIFAGLMVAYIFQNLFVFDSFMTLVSFGVLMGFVFGASAGPSEKSAVQKKPLIAVLLMCVFVVTFIYFVWMPARKVVRFADVMELPLNKRFEQYSSLLTGSHIGNAVDVAELAEASYILYADPESNKRIQTDEKLRAYVIKDISALITYFEVVMIDNPSDYRLRLNTARLYNKLISFDGDAEGERARRAMIVEDEAVALSPNDPQIYWTMAVTRYQAGDKEGARQALQKAEEVAPFLDFSRQLRAEMKL